MSNKLSPLGGFFIGLGLVVAGFLLAKALIDFKQMERTVTAKGLAEQEVVADTAIFPIRFSSGSNQLSDLHQTLKQQSNIIQDFLLAQGFSKEEITTGAPTIVDKQAQQYGGAQQGFRYTATATINVYTKSVDKVVNARKKLLDLTSKGIVIAGNDYQARVEFIFTKLNDLKPKMIEQATNNARQVAQKFAQDSNSTLGKLRKARQGQFSISDRDSNTPHIKKIRIVSTLEYYLAD
ncbi:SIMPL domain-containing protein [Kangiella sp. TOML190]|uniref:SIMPL domain-containing protein n=1 Tax=Kangiella sp. TOML190 TaxID=2931351 RepID=UPI0020416033|nr:SIMPL domain-containing protein [Kangiella sp. TOML190]